MRRREFITLLGGRRGLLRSVPKSPDCAYGFATRVTVTAIIRSLTTLNLVGHQDWYFCVV